MFKYYCMHHTTKTQTQLHTHRHGHILRKYTMTHRNKRKHKLRILKLAKGFYLIFFPGISTWPSDSGSCGMNKLRHLEIMAMTRIVQLTTFSLCSLEHPVFEHLVIDIVSISTDGKASSRTHLTAYFDVSHVAELSRFFWTWRKWKVANGMHGDSEKVKSNLQAISYLIYLENYLLGIKWGNVYIFNAKKIMQSIE